MPIQFLRSPAEREVPEFATSLGLVVIVLGLLAIVGLVPRTGWLTSLAGLLAIAVFVLGVVTLYRVGVRAPTLASVRSRSGVGSS